MPNPPSESQPISEVLPASMGPYTIVRVLGEGGMGTVYLARQHEPLEREVALKVIKPGMDSREILRRFEAERSALARMSHDTVARVFDAGTTERGQPYFVMEYVDGQSLPAYCDARSLTMEQRIRLFIKVCGGVQHAHFKGIVHRDLKPSNVLVSEQHGRAVPKIIDFGLAHATDQRDVQVSRMTGQGQILGTPEYMSPEQASFAGDDVDARTDVYSLGVVLYELLVGTLPLTAEDLRASGLIEGLRRIREGNTPRPSLRLRDLGGRADGVAKSRSTSLPTLARALRGELDWILLKALDKDRDRRYQSPDALAQDLDRHLGHRPILARPPSTVYQLRKYVRRHRGQVAAIAAVLAALLVGLISYAVENGRARRNGEAAIEARGIAEARLQLAMDAVESYFTGVTEDVLLQQAELRELRAKLLAAPIGFYRKLRDSLASTATTMTDRARLAQALVNLAELTTAVGSPAEADATYGDALALQRELAREADAHLEPMLRTMLRRAGVLRTLGRTAEAESLVQELHGEVERFPESQREGWRASANEELAAVVQSSGNYEQAERLLLESITLREARVSKDPRERRALATVRYDLAVVYGFSKNLARAAEQYAAALDLRRALREENPSDLALLDETAHAQQGLAHVFSDMRRYDDAVAGFRAAIELRDALVAARPAVGAHRGSLASVRQDLGLVFAYTRRFAEARAEYEAAIGIFTALVDQNPSVLRYRMLQARSRQNLAELLARMNLHGDGIPVVELAVRELERLVAEHPETVEYRRDLATSANTLALLYQGTGRLADARVAYQRTAEAMKALLDQNPDSTMFRSRLAATLFNLAQLIEQTGAAEDALVQYDAALATAWPSGTEAPQHRLSRIILVRANRGRADALIQLGRLTESLRAFDQAIASAEEDAERLLLRIARLVAVVRQGDPAGAVAELERLLAAAPEVQGDHEVGAAMVLAQAYAATQDPPTAGAAVEHLRRARDQGAFANPLRLEDLRSHVYLDPLRALGDFATLVSDLK